MESDRRWPTVPETTLEAGGWELYDRREESLFRSPTARVDGYTLVYEDDALREAVRGATDGALDRPWRFVFLTRLSFTPPLAPGVGPATWLPTIRREARRAFADDLEERGFVDVTRARGSSFDAGGRPSGLGGRRPDRFTATHVVERGGERTPVRVEAWLTVAVERGSFRLAGGAYPARDFDQVFTDAERAPLPSLDAERFRRELFELLRDDD
ncbi:hypothetical protein ACFO0N_07850 [Halobium salinum]|uniref:Uncharacterized protein n=1 Tax=Halobium salinum TaxID=1364940 RepID=A0ABD5PAG8_9EURY|nr:hypothetical protein [Halobium salinum]